MVGKGMGIVLKQGGWRGGGFKTGRRAGHGCGLDRFAGRTGWPGRKRGWLKGSAGWTWRLARQGSWKKRAAGRTWRRTELHRAGWLIGVLEVSRSGGMVGKEMGRLGEQSGWRGGVLGHGGGRDRAAGWIWQLG